MIKGTRIIEGEDAARYRDTLAVLAVRSLATGFSEVVIPVLGDPSLWIERSGKEIENQMWLFSDKGNRPTCLIPEATAVIQDLYRNGWEQARKKPVRVFYETRCFRYERPQAGRYREFTQFGIEILGPDPAAYEEEAKELLRTCLAAAYSCDGSAMNFEFDDSVERGLSYYSRDGFEVRCEALGAQKQIAGGGTYAEGCGWAIGVDRLLLAMEARPCQ